MPRIQSDRDPDADPAGRGHVHPAGADAQRRARRMKRGPVEVTAFDQDNRRELSTGKLLLIDNIVDQAAATIRLKAMFANEDEDCGRANSSMPACSPRPAAMRSRCRAPRSSAARTGFSPGWSRETTQSGRAPSGRTCVRQSHDRHLGPRRGRPRRHRRPIQAAGQYAGGRQPRRAPATTAGGAP